MIERPTVLLADRSASFLMYLSILLNRMNYEVLPVGDDKTLINMARVLQPGLIALGPDVDGIGTLAVLHGLREDKELSDIPVLVAGEPSTEQEYRAAGCRAFLTKPIDIHQLHSALSEIGPPSAFRRKHLRADFHRNVALSYDNQRIECQGITLSEGGIFIRRRTPFTQGCRLKIEIPISNRPPLCFEGEVLYIKELSKHRFTMPSGMAIRFLDVNDLDRQALKGLIKELLIGDLLQEQDEQILRA